MNATQIFFLGPVWFAVLACAVVIGIFAVIDSAAGQRWQRKRLGVRLGSLRMAGLLDQFQIDRAAYLRETPIPTLRDQLTECRHCSHKADCDAQLSRPVGEADLSFCPNRPRVRRLATRLQVGSAA